MSDLALEKENAEKESKNMMHHPEVPPPPRMLIAERQLSLFPPPPKLFLAEPQLALPLPPPRMLLAERPLAQTAPPPRMLQDDCLQTPTRTNSPFPDQQRMMLAGLADAESPPPPRMLQAHSPRQRHTFPVSLQEAPQHIHLAKQPSPRVPRVQGAEEFAFASVPRMWQAFPLERRLPVAFPPCAAAGLCAAPGFVVLLRFHLALLVLRSTFLVELPR